MITESRKFYYPHTHKYYQLIDYRAFDKSLISRVCNEIPVMKTGCGKILNVGEKAVHLWGCLFCPDCASKIHHPFMAVYSEGNLKEEMICGEIVK